MDNNIVVEIQTLLQNKSEELIKDIKYIYGGLTPEEICVFDEKLFNETEYFDKKYFDEDKFEHCIRRLFGVFPIEDFADEAKNYRRLYVYNKAISEFVGDLNEN